MVSAFTITVIAIDRWRSVTNTNPVDSLTYKQVAIVIVAIWAISFAGKYKNRGRQADNSFPEDVFVTYLQNSSFSSLHRKIFGTRQK